MFSRPQIIETAKTLFHQFTKFGAIGVLNTALYYTLFRIFLLMMNPQAGYYLASMLSISFAVFMNLKFTFQKKPTLRKIATFVSVYLTSMLIGGFVLGIFIRFSISPELGGFLTIGVTVVTNFLGLKAASKWA